MIYMTKCVMCSLLGYQAFVTAQTRLYVLRLDTTNGCKDISRSRNRAGLTFGTFFEMSPPALQDRKFLRLLLFR